MNDKINNDEAFKELFYQEEDEKDKVEESVKTIFAYFDSIKAENNRLKEILDILKPYFKGAVFPSAINFNFSEEDYKLIKGWLENVK